MRILRRGAPLLLAAGLVALAGTGPATAAPDDSVAAGRLPAGTVLPTGAPELPALTATSWLVADLDTGAVLAGKDVHARLAPASTLKVLTALSLLPEVPPATVVRPEQSEIDVEGSKVGLVRGVGYPAEELYAALLMVSGNDAANALAGAAGGQEAAAALMNATAQRLGAVDTHAVNPHGLDAEGQVSSAYDLAVVARAALAQPDIARWAVTQRSTMTAGPGQPRFEIVNKNKLLAGYPGALGLKNGYTSRARASFVGAAERDGRRLVVTLMKADPRVMDEAARLLDWGFSAAAAGGSARGALPAVPPPAPETAQVAAEPAGPVALTPDGAQAAPAAAASSSWDLPGRELAGGALVLGAVLAVRPPRRREPAYA